MFFCGICVLRPLPKKACSGSDVKCLPQAHVLKCPIGDAISGGVELCGFWLVDAGHLCQWRQTSLKTELFISQDK